MNLSINHTNIMEYTDTSLIFKKNVFSVVQKKIKDIDGTYKHGIISLNPRRLVNLIRKDSYLLIYF